VAVVEAVDGPPPAYAVSESNGEVSRIPTLDQGARPAGVTSCQCAPSSRVRQIRPSSGAGPQVAGRDARRGERVDDAAPGADAEIVGRGDRSRFAGTPGAGRVRSRLITSQCSPPSVVRKTLWRAK